MMWSRSTIGAIAIIGAACGGGHEPDLPTPGCDDPDGDGYGVGADCFGDDCAEDDPGRHVGCEAPCAPGSTEPGCPCSVTEPATACYGGPVGTDGVGICRAGVRLCRDGEWSPCEGEVLPLAQEACDYEDDDCDGTIDEGVLSRCGDCNPDCSTTCIGVGCASGFAEGPGTTVRNDGALLADPARDPPDDVWIAMRSENTVLRVDGPTRTPVASYRLGAEVADAVAGDLAVDARGNAFALETSLVGTRPAAVVAVRESDCDDQDDDGSVETSVDDAELPFGTDECVDWRLELETCAAGTCSTASSIALTADGALAWIALEESSEVVEVDLVAGVLTGRSFAVTFPRALLDEGDGTLWVGGGDGWLHPVPLDDPFADERDGIVGAGSIMHLALGPGGDLYAAPPLSILDPATDSLVPFPDDAPHPVTGIAAGADGDVWSANDATTIRRWSSELDEVETFEIASAPQTLAFARDGKLWAATDDPPAIVVIDPDAGAIVVDQIACDDCLVGPALSADPAGLRVERTYGPAWARGIGSATTSWQCEPWAGVFFASATVSVASGAARIEIRTADSAETLGDAPWFDLGTFPPEAQVGRPDDMGPGGWVELRIQTLQPDTVVERIEVFWYCSRGDF